MTKPTILKFLKAIELFIEQKYRFPGKVSRRLARICFADHADLLQRYLREPISANLRETISAAQLP